MEAEACVVVPVHAAGQRLEACFRALDAQDCRSSLEIVASLDGKVDLPPAVRSIADRVVDGPRTGPAGARNRGYRAAPAESILFTDSDCVPEPRWASALLAALKDGADGAKGVYSSGGGAMIQRLAQVEFEERYAMLGSRRFIDLVDTYSAAFRRSALDAVGGFDEGFPLPDHEDVDLSWRMASAGMRLVFVPGARVAHEHRRTWGGYFVLKVSRGRWRMHALRKFPGKAVRDTYTPFCLKAQVALCGLAPAAAAASLLFLPAPAIWLLLFLASCIPLAGTASRTDPGTLPLLPAFAAFRGAALLYGSAWGALEVALARSR
ncbi:glycosyltransferase [Candidatus Fermentibacteria bacterium]|nr:glycosyltransferase [Candidatus Fermentibacteria bacterium]